MHDRRAGRRLVVARPLNRAELVEPGVGDAGESRRERGDFIHDLGRVGIGHRDAERLGESHRRLPVGHAGERRHHLAHAADPPLGVGEGAVLFQERRAREEDMRVARRLVEEQVLHDDAFHRFQARRDVLGVGIGLGDVLALDIEALERALDRLVHHVGNAQARLALESGTPHSSRTSRASRRPRRGGSRKIRAGTSPCRRSPARCSGRARD